MKFDIKKNIFHIVNIILGLVVALTPFQLFPVCTGEAPMGGPMKCYWSGKAIVIIGIAMLVLSILSLLLNKKLMNYISFILVAVLGSMIYLIPTRVIKLGDKKIDGWECGMCMKPTMTCLMTTLPAIKVLMVVIIIVNVAALAFNFLRKE